MPNKPFILTLSISLAFALCVGDATAGTLKTHGIFSSNMVLQRDKPVCIWGWAAPGAAVKVTITEDAKLARPIVAKAPMERIRDWAAERTNFPREVCELALAHANKNKVEAAYQRGDIFEKRRELMDTWSAFATSAVASVIPLRAG